jgi:hypothetical protein
MNIKIFDLSTIIFILIYINNLSHIVNTSSEYTQQQDFKVNSNCLIENEKYNSEFLYTCESREYPTAFVDQHNTKHIKDFDQMRWIFTPVNNNDDYNNKTFYFIINSFYDMLLCSSNTRIGFFDKRRKLSMQNLFKINDFDNEECIWYVEPAKKLYGKYITNKKLMNKDKYIIWNFKYAEPLYAGSFFLKQVKSKRRNVYTWHKKPNSGQFVWNLHCL